jgi:hypothetical protein
VVDAGGDWTSSVEVVNGVFKVVAALAGPCLLSYEIIDPAFPDLPGGKASVTVKAGVFTAGGGGGLGD